MASPLLTGAHVLVYVNNQLFGRVASIDLDQTTPLKEIQTVDYLGSIEIANMNVTGGGSMVIYKTKRDGGIEASGFVARWQDLSRQKYFSLLLIDRSSDTVIYRADKNMVASQKWHYGQELVLGVVTFRSILAENSSQPNK